MILKLTDFLKKYKNIKSTTLINENCMIDIDEHSIDSFSIKIGVNSVLRNFLLNVKGTNNSVCIGSNCSIRGSFFLRQNDSNIQIYDYVTSVNVSIFALEGKTVVIGRDCMISSSVYIRTSDEHSILDIHTSNRINLSKNVILGNHVWVGEGVTINKGVSTGDNVIIGAKSLLSNIYCLPNSIYVGIPAKLVKSGVTWDRRLI